MVKCHNPLKRVKFISIQKMNKSMLYSRRLSQSPQTGQVYFNPISRECGLQYPDNCHNPLKRVKFISISVSMWSRSRSPQLSQSPQTGQVYFNFIDTENYSASRYGHNPLKRVKFISIGFYPHQPDHK